MRQVRRGLKRPTSKSSERPKARRGNGRFITPAEARRRAAQHVLKRMFKGATVRDGATAGLNIFFRGGWTAEDVWVVYKNNPEWWVLKSSEVVLVSKRTGQVLYEGSANDEG